MNVFRVGNFIFSPIEVQSRRVFEYHSGTVCTLMGPGIISSVTKNKVLPGI